VSGNIRLPILLLLACIIGCQLPASIKKAPNRRIRCTDTRDGEVFYVNTDTVRNVAVGYLGAEDCVTVTDENGTDRRMCTSDKAFIKCVETNCPPMSSCQS
jgi:hypothetical protein